MTGTGSRLGARRSLGGLMLLAVITVAGCDELAPRDGAAPMAGEAPAAAEAVDVEAPEVFRTSEPGLWDGRPSLGGTWVAHPDARDPERVRIVNRENGQEVIGALFRRERDLPGPALQVSSDAAEKLGMLPGDPTDLEVVVLRRSEPPAEPAEPAPATDLPAADPSAPDAANVADATAAILRGAATPAPESGAIATTTLDKAPVPVNPLRN